MQELHAVSRALLGMKLHADSLPSPYCGGEPIAFVSRPCDHRAFVIGATDEAVCVVRNWKRRRREQSFGITRDDVVPPNLRHTLRIQASDATWDDAEPCSVAFFALVEQQLHAQANANRRQAAEKRVAHDVAARSKP